MVKGISRQVIVVKSPDPKLFEQAIFILREDAVQEGGITDEALLREAKKVLNSGKTNRLPLLYRGSVWACGGAMLTGAVWLLTCFL